MPCSATCSRAAFIITNIAASPRFGSPISQPVASSKRMTQVGLPCRPIFSSMRSQCTALRVPSGSTLGTSTSDRPLGPAGASGRRHSTRCTMFSVRSCSPPEMKILPPVTRKLPSACGAARVRTWPRSLPAWASVRHMVASHSPLAIFER